MDPRPSPLERGDPELFIEPVVGWRIWRLERSPSGRIRLCSPMQPLIWPPHEAVRSACGRQPGAHGVPGERCGCGIHAASSIEHLRGSGVPFGSTGVIGTVSMWGRVVEHAAGYRAERAYPSRLRLVCPRCVARARLGRPERVARVGDALIPVCKRHAAVVGGEPVAVSPAELEAELLSEYAVEVLPYEPVRAALARARLPEGVRTFTAEARTEARALIGSGSGRFAVVATVLVFFALRALGVIASPDVPERPAPNTVVAVLPLPGTGDPVRYVPPKPAAPFVFPVFVCGHLTGNVVTFLDCSAERTELGGFAEYPPQARVSCPGGGYTRKPAFSVCWLLVDAPAMPHPARWGLRGIHARALFAELPER